VKVRLLPADRAGCSFYRHEEPARIAATEGCEVTIDRNDFTIYQAPFGKVVCSTEPEGDGTRITEWQEDVVVLQRPAKRSTADMIPVLQKRGIAVVVDVDDDFSCLHPQHPARDHFNPSLSPDVNFAHLARACRQADLVTVTTTALAERYGSHGRVAILPNCVPASILDLPRSSDGHTVGWSGALHMHPGDLQVTHGGVAGALRDSDWRFKVIGNHERVGAALGLDTDPDGTGFLDIDEWHRELGSLDIGVVPLCDTKFNEAKSWLKGIEYAARGVPFVASPTIEYQKLAAEGVGVLAADRGRTWRKELRQFMDDESLRHEMTEMGLQVISERHTYETEGWRWVEAWETALARHRRPAPPRPKPDKLSRMPWG